MKNFLRLICLICFLTLAVNGLGFSQLEFENYIIDNTFGGAAGCYSCDVDGDGRNDILGAANQDGLAWWRNEGGEPITWTKQVLDANFSGAFSVYAFDVDDDGDMDILGAAWHNSEMSVWINNGGTPINWQKQIIDGNYTQAHEVFACDFDGDGDGDVFGASAALNDITLWRNDGGDPIVWTMQTIGDNFPGARSVYAADLDGDGDTDVAGAALTSDEVAWWRNDGGDPIIWTKFRITGTFDGSHMVFIYDMDLDGDNDILGAAYAVAEVSWWRNDGGDPVVWTKEVIDNQFGGSLTAYPADFDLDGDVDVVGAANVSDDVTWWRNDNGSWTRFDIDPNFNGAWVVWANDIDGDRDIDVVCAGDAGNHIAWWENDLIGAHFSAEVISGHAPLTVEFSESSVCFPEATSWAWDFDNDGTVDSRDQHPNWTFENPGDYTVVFEVSNDSTTYRLVKENFISVFDGSSALLFNPAISNVFCPASPELNLTEAATLEAWIHPKGWGSLAGLGFGRIVDKGNISLFLNGEGGSLNPYSLAVALMTEGSSSGFLNSPENSISLDTWQHVAVTYDAATSTAKLFINGIEQSLKQVGGAPSGNIKDNAITDLRVGRSLAGMFFNGIIDEVRVWNMVRTGQEISDNYEHLLRGTESGLVAYWNMDEAYGNVLSDGSGNSHDCALEGVFWKQGISLSLPTKIAGQQDNSQSQPEEYLMLQNYPNPFNAGTKIGFQLNETSHVSVAVFDIRGALVRRLLVGRELLPGYHSIHWDGTDGFGRAVSSGPYLCRISDGRTTISKNMLLIK